MKNMFGALRRSACSKGYDPREFALMGLWRALAPLHVNAVARLMGSLACNLGPSPPACCAPWAMRPHWMRTETARSFSRLAKGHQLLPIWSAVLE